MCQRCKNFGRSREIPKTPTQIPLPGIDPDNGQWSTVQPARSRESILTQIESALMLDFFVQLGAFVGPKHQAAVFN